MTVDVSIVNAFTADGNGGNPAGVVLNASNLSDQQMQQIAHKVGAAETAFVLPADKATHRLRFFTPTTEVQICGHATIATWAHMLTNDLHQSGSYTQSTLAGLIQITIDDSGLLFMEQPIQEFGALIDWSVISKELGISDDSFNKSFHPQIVQQALMVALKSKQILNNFELDSARLIAFNKKYNFYGLHLFVMTDSSDTLAAVRDFDPIIGIDEDAATGTTNGAFLTYLRHNNALPKQAIYKIEQGEAMGRLSHIYGKFQVDRVWIGGLARASSHLTIEL